MADADPVIAVQIANQYCPTETFGSSSCKRKNMNLIFDQNGLNWTFLQWQLFGLIKLYIHAILFHR